jgi:hypothetical protein
MIVDPVDTNTLRPFRASVYAVLQGINVKPIARPPRISVDTIKTALKSELGSAIGRICSLVDDRAPCRIGCGAGCKMPGCSCG